MKYGNITVTNYYTKADIRSLSHFVGKGNSSKESICNIQLFGHDAGVDISLMAPFTLQDVSDGREKRQAPIGVLNPPIPTSVGHYLGEMHLL